MDTALLIALPISPDALMAKGRCSDWARRFLHDVQPQAQRGKGNAAFDRFAARYELHVSTHLRALVEAANQHGIAVVTDASLVDVRTATRKFTNVILIAHWKGADFAYDDLLIGDRELAETLANGSGITAEAARNWLAKEEPTHVFGRWFGDRRKRSRGRFAETLNAVLYDESLRDTAVAGADLVLYDRDVQAAHRREEIQRAAAPHLAAGNRLELGDALVTREQVGDAIAPSFAGTLDLCSCTSSYLGDYLRARFKSEFHVVQAPRVQEPIWLVHALRLTLDLLATGRFEDYLACRYAALDRLQRDVVTVMQHRRGAIS